MFIYLYFEKTRDWDTLQKSPYSYFNALQLTNAVPKAMHSRNLKLNQSYIKRRLIRQTGQLFRVSQKLQGEKQKANSFHRTLKICFS